VRLLLADQLKLIPKDRWEFVWITGFACSKESTDKCVVSAQHPFTALLRKTFRNSRTPPTKCAFQCVRRLRPRPDGSELGSGSIRIISRTCRSEWFRALGLSQNNCAPFRFFLDALTYGTPPPAASPLGIRPRSGATAGEKSIREVIAFPKTARPGLMAEAPSNVDQTSLIYSEFN